MYRAKRSAEWDHTAKISSEIRNAAFGRKRLWQAKELHPFHAQKPAAKLNRERSAKLLDNVFGTVPTTPSKPVYRPVSQSRIDALKQLPLRRST